MRTLRIEPTVIVIAWVIDDIEVVRQRRSDLGEKPITRPIKVAKSVTWCIEGLIEELIKAQEFAKMNGYTVYTFPQFTDIDKAHESAKQSVMREVAIREEKAAANQKFERAFRAAKRLIELLKKGQDEKSKACKAIEKLYDIANGAELRGNEAIIDRISKLHHERVEAYEIYDRIRSESLESAAKEARKAERDNRPLPGTYKHELALMRK